MISYQIPITGLKISTNKFYAGTSNWNQRKQLKATILDFVTCYCHPREPLRTYPVEITYRFVFTSRVLDTLNTAIMAKMFEDALCTVGVLEDDSPTYVRRSTLEVIKSHRQLQKDSPSHLIPEKEKEDWLEITIKPYESK